MKCPKCGSDRPAEARFCSECGTSLIDSTGDTTTMIPVAVDAPEHVELTEKEREAARALSPGTVSYTHLLLPTTELV